MPDETTVCDANCNNVCSLAIRVLKKNVVSITSAGSGTRHRTAVTRHCVTCCNNPELQIVVLQHLGGSGMPCNL